MVGYVKVFLYLSAGEVIVRLTGFPIPGSIVGLTLMLADFAINGQIDSDVGRIFDGVSKHLAILFVPAGAGVIAYSAVLSSGVVVIVTTIVAGTLVTMLVTAFLFRWLFTERSQHCEDYTRPNELPE